MPDTTNTQNVAESHLSELIAKTPDDWESRKKLAQLLYNENKTAQAAEVIWEAPEIPSIDLELGFAVKILGKGAPRKAIRLLTGIQELNQGKAVQNLGLANALLHHGMVMQAARFYGAALAEDPTLASADLEHFLLWIDDKEKLWGAFEEVKPNLTELPWMKRDAKEAELLKMAMAGHSTPIKIPNLSAVTAETVVHDMYVQSPQRDSEPTPPPAVTIPIGRVERKHMVIDPERGAGQPITASQAQQAMGPVGGSTGQPLPATSNPPAKAGSLITPATPPPTKSLIAPGLVSPPTTPSTPAKPATPATANPLITPGLASSSATPTTPAKPTTPPATPATANPLTTPGLASSPATPTTPTTPAKAGSLITPATPPPTKSLIAPGLVSPPATPSTPAKPATPPATPATPASAKPLTTPGLTSPPATPTTPTTPAKAGSLITPATPPPTKSLIAPGLVSPPATPSTPAKPATPSATSATPATPATPAAAKPLTTPGLTYPPVTPSAPTKPATPPATPGLTYPPVTPTTPAKPDAPAPAKPATPPATPGLTYPPVTPTTPAKPDAPAPAKPATPPATPGLTYPPVTPTTPAKPIAPAPAKPATPPATPAAAKPLTTPAAEPGVKADAAQAPEIAATQMMGDGGVPPSPIATQALTNAPAPVLRPVRSQTLVDGKIVINRPAKTDDGNKDDKANS